MNDSVVPITEQTLDFAVRIVELFQALDSKSVVNQP